MARLMWCTTPPTYALSWGSITPHQCAHDGAARLGRRGSVLDLDSGPCWRYTVRSCMLDGELIATGAHGEPEHARKAAVCVYAFDLLELQGWDLNR